MIPLAKGRDRILGRRSADTVYRVRRTKGLSTLGEMDGLSTPKSRPAFRMVKVADG